MQKYRVLKAYPKQITNSGRLITLKKGASVYLKNESQVTRLVKLGFIKPIVELPKKQPKKPKVEAQPAPKPVEESKKASKSENYKKNKDEQSSN